MRFLELSSLIVGVSKRLYNTHMYIYFFLDFSEELSPCDSLPGLAKKLLNSGFEFRDTSLPTGSLL